ncbi:MAG: acyl-CoA dehydrogenase [Streptosporangiaceae bacterium]|jgi:alkylation response protein AidB-like acyl-CoA dehydrogenase
MMLSDAGSPGLRAADVCDYRQVVRKALVPFDTATVSRWESARHVPTSAIACLARAGVFRARWENGAERGLPHLVVFSEEMFRCSSGLAECAMGHSEMFTGALTWLASDPWHHELLEMSLDGRAVGCFAATELHGGSDLAAIKTKAERSSAGWRIDGSKRYITNIGSATHVLVLARDSKSSAANDLSLFIVPTDVPGVSIDGFFDMVGLQECDVGQASFHVDLPGSALLGRRGLGLLYVTHLLQFERLSICAQLIAAAESALDLAVAYARGRETAGVRIMDRQTIRHRLAFCQAELWNLESRISDLVERASRTGHMPAHEIAALKLTAGDGVGRIVDICMQVFGARGSSRNFPLEKLWRDARLARLGGGADEVLADMVGSYLDRPDEDINRILQRAIAHDDPC